MQQPFAGAEDDSFVIDQHGRLMHIVECTTGLRQVFLMMGMPDLVQLHTSNYHRLHLCIIHCTKAASIAV